jgi:hypothetical protein
MLELICQQRYRVGGVPTDITPYRNHGSAIDAPGLPGPYRDKDVIRFPNPDSRVKIDLGTLGAWAPLQALKIEVVARLDPRAGRTLGLAAGDGSFFFFVGETALEAIVYGPAGNMHIRCADADSPDGALHAVPANRWTTLAFYHDGFAKMRLAIDGKIVGTKVVAGGVPSVKAGGVAIGNAVGAGSPLHGDIDEISFWRLDPNEMRREFLCREYDAKAAQCWAAIFRAIHAWAAAHPSQAKSLFGLIEQRMNEFIRALYLLPEKDQADMRAVLRDYARQWCKGPIDGHKMEKVLHRWVSELHRLKLDKVGTLDFGEISRLLSGFDLEKLNAKCDPMAIAFLELLRKAHEAEYGKAG